MFQCEISARKILPIVRKELTIALREKGLRVGEISKLLETTPAAISQYLSGKRGHFSLVESELIEIKKIANQSKIKQADICKLCKVITKRMNLENH